jgi:hypothetical protein
MRGDPGMPDHQNPREKRFFQGLNTKKVSDVPSSAIKTLSDPVSLEGQNKEVLQSIVLVNEATMRDGNHIPATGSIKTGTATESGTRATIDFGGTNGNPSKGEVWGISAMTIESVAGGSGDVIYEVFVGDGTELQSVVKRTQTTPPVHLNQELEYPHGLEIDENMTLQFSATRASLSSAKIQVYAYRLR